MKINMLTLSTEAFMRSTRIEQLVVQCQRVALALFLLFMMNYNPSMVSISSIIATYPFQISSNEGCMAEGGGSNPGPLSSGV